MGFLGGPWRAGGGQGEAVAGPKESVVEGCQRQMTHQKPRSTSLLLGPVQKHQTGAALQISFVEEPPGTGSVLGPAAEHPREPLMTGSQRVRGCVFASVSRLFICSSGSYRTCSTYTMR